MAKQSITRTGGKKTTTTIKMSAGLRKKRSSKAKAQKRGKDGRFS